MALTQSLDVFDAKPKLLGTRPIPRNNVLLFPAPRVLLPVTLLREPTGRLDVQLRTLLRSPLGVYVVDTAIVRGGVRLQFDIAPEDLDFTLHTLIATLPRAMIGAIKRRSAAAKTS